MLKDLEKKELCQNNGVLDKLSVSTKINLVILFISSVVFLTSNILGYYQLLNGIVKSNEFRIAAVTEAALNLIKKEKARVDAGELTEEEAKAEALRVVSNINYDGKNYIWINDYEDVFLAHPKLKGKDGTSLKDKNGVQIILEATKIAKNKGEGRLKYLWPKPGQDTNIVYAKTSYIRNFEDWKWVIGSGYYDDDVTAQSFSAIKKDFIWNIVINLAIILIAVILVSITISKSIVKPIKSLSYIALRLADNDLTVKIPHDENKTEIGELYRSFEKFVSNFKQLIKQVINSSEDVSASSQEMSASAEQTAQGSQQTATSTTQLAIGAQEISRNMEDGAININKMNKAIQGVSEEAKVVAKLGDDTEYNANEGAGHVKKAVVKIDSIKKVSGEISLNISELGKLSAEIEEIVDLIKNIAGQTNLLALNAAIEAARAGEHGKGFAVVADEVKKLAGQSAEATEKITSMIKEIQHKTQNAVSTMDKATTEVEEGVFIIRDAGNALENIIKQAKAANDKIQGITKEISLVADNSQDMVQMIESISAITEETAASAEEISSITQEQTASLQEISASSHTLATIAEKLTKIVSAFKV